MFAFVGQNFAAVVTPEIFHLINVESVEILYLIARERIEIIFCFKIRVLSEGVLKMSFAT
jgi:hypothetical protein